MDGKNIFDLVGKYFEQKQLCEYSHNNNTSVILSEEATLFFAAMFGFAFGFWHLFNVPYTHYSWQ